ncbi:MAG: hypothetical protein GY782_05295 [Gammaproteobacteria bacterium]|nr:hypothetical protein [Gammaproteobacteria bacterium]
MQNYKTNNIYIIWIGKPKATIKDPIAQDTMTAISLGSESKVTNQNKVNFLCQNKFIKFYKNIFKIANAHVQVSACESLLENSNQNDKIDQFIFDRSQIIYHESIMQNCSRGNVTAKELISFLCLYKLMLRSCVLTLHSF